MELKTIKYLLEKLKKGEIGIPDFQRNYVWESTQVLSLLDSLQKKFPIGSIILWKPEKIGNAKIQTLNISTISNNKPELYILDGQQRIISLFLAFYDIPIPSIPEKKYYYVDERNSKKIFKALKTKNGTSQKLFDETCPLRNELLSHKIPIQIVSAEREIAYEIFKRINGANTPLSGLKFLSAWFAVNSTKSIKSLDNKLDKLANKVEIPRTYLDDWFEKFNNIESLEKYVRSNLKDNTYITKDFNDYHSKVIEVYDFIYKLSIKTSFMEKELFKELLFINQKMDLKLFFKILLKRYHKDYENINPSSYTFSKKELINLFTKEDINEKFLYYIESSNKAVDYNSKSKLISREFNLELHHIFPKTKFSSYKNHNFMLTWISDNQNKIIGNILPSEQYKKFSDSKYWNSHFISKKNTLKAIKTDNPQDFLKFRKIEIIDYIWKIIK